MGYLITSFSLHYCKKLKISRFLECFGEALPIVHMDKRLKTNFHSIDNIPARHGSNCPQIVWDQVGHRFTFIIDGQPLCKIVNGKSPLQQLDLQIVFERITNKIFGMFKNDWAPNVLRSDPVVWHRREYNEI